MKKLCSSKTMKIIEDKKMKEDCMREGDEEEIYAPKNIDFIHFNIG